MKGIKRHHVTCAKCGYEWMAYTENPKRCALCGNPNISQPKTRRRVNEKYGRDSLK